MLRSSFLSLILVLNLSALCAAAALPFLLPADTTARSQVWVQTFASPSGGNIDLLELLHRETRVTHVYLAAVHLNSPPGNIHINDHPHDHTNYDYLWPQIKTLQANGIKVLIMLGGAAQGSYWRLNGDFEAYYQPLLSMLKRYNIDGIDLDIEEEVPLELPLKLLRRLDADMGHDFILTMAPVATGMFPPPYDVNLSGFSYSELDRQATSQHRPYGKLVNWYNCQFYNGWGDASGLTYYNAIVLQGHWHPYRIALGVLDHPGNGGSGFVPLGALKSTIQQLRTNYRDFGGVIGWEYFNAGQADKLAHPWMWMKAVGEALYDPYERTKVNMMATPSADPPSPWPNAVDELMSKGVGHFEAIKALNATGGRIAEAKAAFVLPVS